MMEKYLYIAGALALTVYGQLIMKARALVHAPGAASLPKSNYLWAMYTDIGVLSGLLAGVLASACWALAIEKLDLGLAYPFMALSFVVVPLSASFLFSEPVSLRQFVGLCVIVVGIALSTVGR
jgi:multidrug transporter EmrE-like cation transporter